MKSILVLTDFSENAQCASALGLALSKKLRTNLLLFNSFSAYPIMASYAGGPWVVDEFIIKQSHSKKQLSLLAENLEDIANQYDDLERTPSISCLCGEGDVGSNVADIIEQKDIELVVMGARADKSDNHILFGRDTSSVIRKATRPVLAIPSKFDFEGLNKVVFATDFNKDDITAIKYLIKLGKLFNYQLDIIHVNELGKGKSINSDQVILFKERVTKLKYPGISYHEVWGKDIVERLNGLCNETGAGLLAITHHQDPFLIRILQKSTSKKALADQKIPLMIFPSSFK